MSKDIYFVVNLFIYCHSLPVLLIYIDVGIEDMPSLVFVEILVFYIDVIHDMFVNLRPRQAIA